MSIFFIKESPYSYLKLRGKVLLFRGSTIYLLGQHFLKLYHSVLHELNATAYY